jgi:hypothetical protein
MALAQQFKTQLTSEVARADDFSHLERLEGGTEEAINTRAAVLGPRAHAVSERAFPTRYDKLGQVVKPISLAGASDQRTRRSVLRDAAARRFQRIDQAQAWLRDAKARMALNV